MTFSPCAHHRLLSFLIKALVRGEGFPSQMRVFVEYNYRMLIPDEFFFTFIFFFGIPLDPRIFVLLWFYVSTSLVRFPQEPSSFFSLIRLTFFRFSLNRHVLSWIVLFHYFSLYTVPPA